LREGHFVRFADAEVDDFLARMCGDCGAFGAFDFLEFIDRGRLAVLAAADPFGKQILNVRVSHNLNRPTPTPWAQAHLLALAPDVSQKPWGVQANGFGRQERGIYAAESPTETDPGIRGRSNHLERSAG